MPNETEKEDREGGNNERERGSRERGEEREERKEREMVGDDRGTFSVRSLPFSSLRKPLWSFQTNNSNKGKIRLL